MIPSPDLQRVVFVVWLLLSPGCGPERSAPASDVAAPPETLRQDTAPMVHALHTQGRFIVDAAGDRVRLRGINWNGGHEEGYVPYGLDHHAPAEIAARIVALGFNSVRLTYSDEMVATNPVPDPPVVAAVPDLAGRPALEVFDAVVEALTDAGVYVILNDHMSDAAWCCSLEDGNALWYNERWSEDQWIANWVALAERYRDDPLVVGADLRNEPRLPALWSAPSVPEVPSPRSTGREGPRLGALAPLRQPRGLGPPRPGDPRREQPGLPRRPDVLVRTHRERRT